MSERIWYEFEVGHRMTRRPGAARAMGAALGSTPDFKQRLAHDETPVEAPVRPSAAPGVDISANVSTDNLPPGLAAPGDQVGTLRDHSDEQPAVIRRAVILQKEMARRLGITFAEPG